MTTQTLTLTDFLLARIAEDEAVVPDWHRAECARGARPAAACDCGAHQSPTWTRVLAECEAKRRIVELRLNVDAISNDKSWTRVGGDGYRHALEIVLADLALPYADHPDYREEWKP